MRQFMVAGLLWLTSGPVLAWQARSGDDTVTVALDERTGALDVRLEPAAGEVCAFTLAPVWEREKGREGEGRGGRGREEEGRGERRREGEGRGGKGKEGKQRATIWAAGGNARVSWGQAVIRASVRQGQLRLRIEDDSGSLLGLQGTLVGSGSLYPCRVWLERGRPATHGGRNVLQSAVGRASATNCNAIYSVETFYGLTIEAKEGTPCIQPVDGAYRITLPPGDYTLRPADLWPVVGWRPPDQGATYGIGERRDGYLVPREWLRDRRPFPWETLSPVQLPFISITDPAAFADVKAQIDFLERELRDWGFFCYGEWPLTQRNPEYDPDALPAYLEGNRRTCDYAHAHGIKILRWVTDPDILPDWFPRLYERFLAAGWFAPFDAAPGQYLLDYSHPDVCAWLRGIYEQLGRTGPDFYWVDNNMPTQPVREPNRFPPDVFRNFYRAIQAGLLASGRGDILIRSGASAWADYSAVGILDVYAPGPDVQNDWEEQQIFVARELAMRDYLCHFNLWRRSIDDYFPAGPMTIDQTRAMASLLALTGLSFTTTDIGLPNIPPERLDDLRRLVPIPTVRPFDLFRFRGVLPTWWVQHREDGGRAWALVGVFNWGLHDEECPFATFEELGLDPDAGDGTGTEPRPYFVYDVWSQRPVGLFTGGIGLRLAPASGRLLATHPLDGRPFLVATDRHAAAGAAEIRGLVWEVPVGAGLCASPPKVPKVTEARLSGQFTAGVAGQTFHLTFYVPDGWRAAQAKVDGREVTCEKEGPLVRVPLVCDGPELTWAVTFAQTEDSENRPIRNPQSAIRNPQSAIPDASSLLSQARSGTAVFVRAPATLDAATRAWQQRTGLRWGLYRSPSGGPMRLTVATPRPEAAEGAVFRTAEVAFRVGLADAVARRVGAGVLVVVSPDVSRKWETELKAQAMADPKAWMKAVASEWQAALDQATCTVVDWRVENGAAVGALRVSPWLKGKQLTLHLRRVLPSIQPNYWGIPDVSVAINGTDLPRHLNPCRPHSPPEGWDLTTFRIPDGLVRFDAVNELTIYPAQPADPDRLLADLKDAVELRMEDVAVAGETELGELPAVAFCEADRYDALLGIDGGLRVLAEAPGVSVRLVQGKPYNGWPMRPDGVTHCVFDEQRLALEIEVPRGSAGTVEAYAYDADDYRVEYASFEGREAVRVDQFGAGKWLRFPFGLTESADGRLLLQVVPEKSANAVLSRIRVTLD